MPGVTTKVPVMHIKDYDLVIGGQGNKNSWRPGVMSIVDESRLPIGAVVQAKNCMQTQDGVWSNRWGSMNYGQTFTGPVTGFTDFVTYNTGSGYPLDNTTQYYMILDNGILKYAKDGGAWASILRTVGAPGSAPTATAVSGAGLSSGVYGYKITYVSGGGETLVGPNGAVTTSAGNDKVNLTAIPTGPTSVTARKIYRTKVGGSTYYLVTTLSNNSATTYTDTTADASLVTLAPTIDTSTIPFYTGSWTQLEQFGNNVLICNGVDKFSYVQLSNMTWVGFTGLSTPAAPTSALSSGLASGTNNLYYQITAISPTGETPGSPVLTVGTNLDRNTWWNPNTSTATTSTTYVTLSWTAISNAIGYNIYLSDGVSGVSYYLDSVFTSSGGTITYVDYGYAVINDFQVVPSSDTTVAPEFYWIALSDNRLWAIGDPNNPNRLYWAATGQNELAFNAALGGGWVDILPGGKQAPYWVGQFRNGQGNPMTTILLSEQTGYGTTWHCQITTDTIGNTVVAVPSLTEGVQGFGTTSPRSVVETNQNAYFYSPGPAGYYSTGSVQTLFNILATNEVSYVIRPDMKALTFQAVPGICAMEFDRKIFLSVPYGGSSNNRVMVYDLNKENWNPYAVDFGVAGWCRYSDNSGQLHLLAISNVAGSTKIIEFNSSFIGDNAVGFDCHIQTGLIHVTADHVQFARIRYIYYEFGSPNGEINLVFAGTTKNEPLSQLASYTISEGDLADNVGFSSFPFSAEPFSYTSLAPTATTQLSVKERIRINKFLNNWEAEVYSDSLNSTFTLNQIIVKGQLVPTADPSGWIVN